ncbi:MAG: maleylacetate reductase, partial [Betaproteobacteria bacterium]|nr:maleylacetate reductase [Betaproteobacteria bacterium]
TDAVRSALSQIGAQSVGVFDECVEHTPRDSVIALVHRMRETRADLIVTLGGGTAIDTVKVALVCMAQGVDTIEGMDALHMRVLPDGSRHTPVIGEPPLRQIALPTTLSAAEFSDLAGCTDRRVGAKHAYTAPCIGPASVILDPAMTVHTPRALWFSTGIRAIDHAVESICSIDAQPLTDATCLHALRLLAPALRHNDAHPDDLDGRLQSQLGVWLSASGINRVNFGASHGIGHVLGGALGMPHGITSCVMLPAVLRYNAALPEQAARQRLISEAMGDATRSAADLVQSLIAALGLPTRLRDAGVSEDLFASLSEKAMQSHWVRTNPRKIDAPAQVEEILRSAW